MPGFITESLGLREVDHDRDRLLSRHLAGPPNHIFFDPQVEVAFAKRQGIQRVEQLADILDAQLDGPGVAASAARHDDLRPLSSGDQTRRCGQL